MTVTAGPGKKGVLRVCTPGHLVSVVLVGEDK